MRHPSRPTAPTASRPLSPTPVALAILALLPLAAPHAAERELDAHEHGAATLDVAVDGERLYLDLDSPAANLLGFEHAPSDDAQRDRVDSVRETLESGATFVPSEAAGCTLESADVDIALAEDDDDDHGHGHGDEDHGDEDHDDGEDHGDEAHADGEDHAADGEHAGEHDDEADGAHDDDHDEDDRADGSHDDDHAGDSGHSDVVANYVFACADPDALDGVRVTLFEAFDGFEEIDVQIVGPNGQDAAELVPGRVDVPLAGVR